MLNKTTGVYDLHIIYNTLRVVGNAVIKAFDGLVSFVTKKLTFTQPPKAWNSGTQCGDTKTGVYGTYSDGGYRFRQANQALAVSDLSQSNGVAKIKGFEIEEETADCKFVYNNKDFPLTTAYNLTSKMMMIETLDTDNESTQQDLFYDDNTHFYFLVLTGSVTNLKWVGWRPKAWRRVIILNKTNHTVNLVHASHADYSSFYYNDTLAPNQAKSYIDNTNGALLKIS